MHDLPSLSRILGAPFELRPHSSISALVRAHLSSSPAAATAHVERGSTTSRATGNWADFDPSGPAMRSMTTPPGSKVTNATRAWTVRDGDAYGCGFVRICLERKSLIMEFGGLIFGSGDCPSLSM